MEHENRDIMWKNRKNKNPLRVPKLCGADVELGNFILGGQKEGDTGFEASRILLRHIDGLPLRAGSNGYGFGFPVQNQDGRAEYPVCGFPSWYSIPAGGTVCAPYNPQDWGRKFLPANGGCAYIDLDHLEICLPEIISAWDYVAAWHAMLNITRRAFHEANRSLAPNGRIQVLVNNSDGNSNSYGSHLNFLITRRTWDNLFLRKMHHLLFLAAYQVSSIVFSGQGKVGVENGGSEVPFQISQRADFFETLLGSQTTFNRPIVNSRDEALCGKSRTGPGGCARLHVIFFDSTLSHVATLLKVGVTQIILSMIEAEFVNPNLVLDDPVHALSCYSRDPSLRACALTVTGRSLTALELQYLFFEDAARFVAKGGCEGIVPGADEILQLWGDTLQKLRERQFVELSRRIDWILKLQIIDRAMAQQPGLTWESPQIRYLDQLYSSLDDREGLYWIYEKHGFTEKVVGKEKIVRFMNNPPEDTRAYGRAMLLRKADPAEVDAVDWDSITFNIRDGNGWPNRKTIDLAHPLRYTKEMTQQCFQGFMSLEDTLDFVKATDPECRISGDKNDDSIRSYPVNIQ
jgi:hypothetical protein